MKKSRKQWLLSAVFAIGCSIAAYAQLPYNTALTQSHYNNGSTVIKKEGQQKWENGIRLGTTGLSVGNWDDKYIVIALNQSSIPYQLTFKYKCNSIIATNPDWYVEESADNANWSRIWSAVTPTSTGVSVSTSTYTASPIDLSKSTKYLKLCYSGNYSGTFSEIKVSDQAYVHDPVVDDVKITSLDFGTGSISSGKEEKSFDIEWCNINALSVTCDNTDFFTVSPASFGGKAKYGTQTITVAYNRDKEVGTHSGTITITNGSNTKTVTVSGSTTRRSQAIHWNADLAATNFTLNAGDSFTGAEIAIADNEEAEMTYTTSDAEIIAVSEDGKTLQAIANGTATITANATGNDIYDEAVDSKEFTVTSKSKQTITWEQNLLGLKTTQANATITLEATATSGGVITYAIEGGSANCIRLSGENNATLTITGAAGEAFIIATQAGGLIGEEEWISATYRKHVKVRDPNSACDEYALADKSFTFSEGHKSTFAVQEYKLDGKPTNLTFTAKAGGTQYLWSKREPIYIDQYANFGSGLEWQQLTAETLEENSKNYGPYALNETATKIRFRTGDYSKQEVSNISVPRKKELVVSETSITEEAERNVRWSKTISVSRSNIDVVDISVVSSDPACPFELDKTSIGTDCADRSTETFTVSITPHERNAVYTGTITITDGKATPTTHTIDLSIKAVAFQQTINGFELPAEALTTAEIPAFAATATSGLEVVYLSSDSTVAYVENNRLVVLSAGTVAITAYQAGDEKYDPASDTKTITLSLTPVEITVAPTASALVVGESLAQSVITGGEASVEGTFAWQDETITPEEGERAYTVLFTPDNTAIYATATTEVTVQTTFTKHDQSIVWNDEIPELYPNRTFDLAAYSTADLEVSFVSSDSTVAYVENNELRTLKVGQATITAVQAGNEFYNAAEPVAKTVTVVRIPDAYGDYTITICEGDSAEFRGTWYKEAGTTDVLLEEKNILGGDSIVRLTVGFYPVYLKEETMEIYAGTDTTWQGHDLSEIFPVADTTIVSEYKSLNDCDSTYTLHLTVLAPTRYGVYDAAICEGDSVEYEGKWYYGAAEEEVTLAQKNYYGGDSIVTLTVAVHPVYAFNEEMTMYAGADSVWQKKNLSELTVGDTTIVAEYKTIHGCDSTYTLLLHVQTPPTHYGELNVSLCSGEKFVYEGKTYRRPTQESVTLAQKNIYGGDSIVELTVNVYPKMNMESSMTIIKGTDTTWENIDLSVLPVGDTTLVAAYKSIHDCDSTYTLYLTVEPIPTAYGEYEAAFCEGDSVEYAGTWYYEATETEILLDEKSTLGGDSIVRLTVTVHPVESTEETRQIVLGTEEVWNEIDFSALSLGDTTLVVKGTTEYGCDYTHTLYLTVEPVPTAYGEYEAAFCEGDSVEYAGTWYYEATEKEILLGEKSTLGGDSIVRLTVTVHPVESTEETRQIVLGTEEVWNEIDFSALPLGDTTLVVKGTTEYGCDSTHTLYLTVVKKTATAIDQTQADLQPAAAKELRNGLIYIRKGDDLYDVCGRKVETVRL